MTFEESKKLQEQEFKFLDTKDLKPLLNRNRTIDDIAYNISILYGNEYEGEEFILNVIDTYELAEYLEKRYGVRFMEITELVLVSGYSDDKSLKRRIRFISGTREYSYVEDFTDYIDELIQCNNEYSDTGEKITRENYQRYIEPYEFRACEIDKYNGVHAVYGILESFSQSYGGSVWLNDCNENDELFIVFERYDDTGLEV